MPILEAQHLSKSYRLDHRDIPVLIDIDLAIDAGEFLVIQGASGSGKSTLLSVLSGLDRPTAGRVLLDGQIISDLPETQMAPLRNRTIGFVFQSFHLVPSLSALENIMLPAELNGDATARNRAMDLLNQVGLDHRKDNLPPQLSGGERQRVAICRALINCPAIVFADEPTGNLDSRNGGAIMDLMIRFLSESNTTLVLVTHSRDIARRADRVVHIIDGQLGASHDVAPS